MGYLEVKKSSCPFCKFISTHSTSQPLNNDFQCRQCSEFYSAQNNPYNASNAFQNEQDSDQEFAMSFSDSSSIYNDTHDEFFNNTTDAAATSYGHVDETNETYKVKQEELAVDHFFAASSSPPPPPPPSATRTTKPAPTATINNKPFSIANKIQTDFDFSLDDLFDEEEFTVLTKSNNLNSKKSSHSALLLTRKKPNVIQELLSSKTKNDNTSSSLFSNDSSSKSKNPFKLDHRQQQHISNKIPIESNKSPPLSSLPAHTSVNFQSDDDDDFQPIGLARFKNHAATSASPTPLPNTSPSLHELLDLKKIELQSIKRTLRKQGLPTLHAAPHITKLIKRIHRLLKEQSTFRKFPPHIQEKIRAEERKQLAEEKNRDNNYVDEDGKRHRRRRVKLWIELDDMTEQEVNEYYLERLFSKKEKKEIEFGEDGEQMEKRPRGRPPKKPKLEEQEEDEHDEHDSDRIGVEAPKRGPGRPPKKQPELVMDENGELMVNVKRGPGRPRLNKPITVDDESSELSTGVKRGPGRPRLDKPPVTYDGNNDEEISDKPSVPAVDSGRDRSGLEDGPDVAVEKRGPGRPRLNKPAIEGSDADDEGNFLLKRGPGRPKLNKLTANKDNEEESKPKRGPGRPRLNKPATATRDGEPFVKRGPGRPKLNKITTSTDSDSDKDGHGSPSLKRGPGRPRLNKNKATTHDTNEQDQFTFGDFLDPSFAFSDDENNQNVRGKLIFSDSSDDDDVYDPSDDDEQEFVKKPNLFKNKEREVIQESDPLDGESDYFSDPDDNDPIMAQIVKEYAEQQRKAAELKQKIEMYTSKKLSQKLAPFTTTTQVGKSVIAPTTKLKSRKRRADPEEFDLSSFDTEERSATKRKAFGRDAPRGPYKKTRELIAKGEYIGVDDEFELDLADDSEDSDGSKQQQQEFEEEEEEELTSNGTKRRPTNKFNPYIVFHSENRAIIAQEYPGLSNRELSLKVGEIWRGLDPDARRIYKERSDAKKEEYNKKNGIIKLRSNNGYVLFRSENAVKIKEQFPDFDKTKGPANWNKAYSAAWKALSEEEKNHYRIKAKKSREEAFRLAGPEVVAKFKKNIRRKLIRGLLRNNKDS